MRGRVAGSCSEASSSVTHPDTSPPWVFLFTSWLLRAEKRVLLGKVPSSKAISQKHEFLLSDEPGFKFGWVLRCQSLRALISQVGITEASSEGCCDF